MNFKEGEKIKDKDKNTYLIIEINPEINLISFYKNIPEGTPFIEVIERKLLYRMELNSFKEMMEGR